MCTVTYLPQGQDSFILTSNRDEAPSRSPHEITVTREGGRQLAFPRDAMAGGTWLAASSDNRLVCLLNGAFERHDRRPPYRLSRGIMVLEYFSFTDSEAFFKGFDFEGMEPFTMVVYDQGKLHELKWDEHQAHIRQLDTKGCYIWSSATLYEPAMQRKRERWFADWLDDRHDFSRAAILDFHHHAGEGDPWNDVIMNRNNLVRTVSISSILKKPDEIHFQYEDLLRNQISEAQIPVENEVVGSR